MFKGFSIDHLLGDGEGFSFLVWFGINLVDFIYGNQIAIRLYEINVFIKVLDVLRHLSSLRIEIFFFFIKDL